MTIGTAQCPKCPARMIRYHTTPVVDPARSGDCIRAWHTEWWCNCGYWAYAGLLPPDKIADDRFELWRCVNRQRRREAGEPPPLITRPMNYSGGGLTWRDVIVWVVASGVAVVVIATILRWAIL